MDSFSALFLGVGSLIVAIFSTLTGGGASLLLMPLVGFFIGTESIAPVMTIGTNLSVRSDQGWEYDDARLMIFDIRNFGRLGLGLDELIEGFVQTCMAVYAIDRRALAKYPRGEVAKP